MAVTESRQAEGDRVRFRRSARRIGPEQSHLQSLELRWRQPPELLLADPVEQVDERRRREPRLGSAPPRREHPQPPLPGEVDPGLPERRLPDSRPTREHERPR